MSPRRWPPDGPGGTDPLAEPAWCGELRAAIGDMSDALKYLTPTPVLGSATYVLNAAGQATEQYRTPFRALAITSASAGQLTLSSSPPQASAPGPGVGSAIILPRGFAVVNMGPGYVWTIYGGSPGEQISVQAFTTPQMAQSVPGPAGTAASTSATGSAADPIAGTVIASVALPAGTYVLNWDLIMGGTVSGADQRNVQLLVGATSVQIANNGSNGGVTYPQVPVTIVVPAGGATVALATIGAGSGTATYNVQMTATPALAGL
jgi:hypothetical protein